MEGYLVMEVNDNNKKKNKGHTIRNFILFILFLASGIALGYFGTIKYLEYKNNLNQPDDEVVNNGPKDITEDEKSKDLINSLYATINGEVMFYSTKGINISTLDNTSKLKLVYNQLVANKQGISEKLDSLWWGAQNCNYEFLVDPSTDVYNPTNSCTIIRINRSLFMETNKKLFNDEILDTSVTFSPEPGKSCVVDPNNGETYICGNVINQTGITGSLESKFTIQKVTKDEDGTIVIYEKGYLVDKRSTVGTEYDNYYLHSSDSTDYYYELKSADNLTFKHTFKTDDKINYYYVSTELSK